MRPLRCGERVRFMAFSGLSGDYETEGYVEQEATAWIKQHKNEPEIDPMEYEGLQEDEAYIIQTEDIYGNVQRHLVYVGNIAEVLPAEKDN